MGSGAHERSGVDIKLDLLYYFYVGICFLEDRLRYIRIDRVNPKSGIPTSNCISKARISQVA